jgi:hypothetical protein
VNATRERIVLAPRPRRIIVLPRVRGDRGRAQAPASKG